MKELKIQFIALLGLFILYILNVITKDYGDTNTLVFSTILYVPYVIGLLIFNGFIIKITETINFKRRFLNFILPIVIMLLFYIANNCKIEIRYWNLNFFEFLSIILILLISNLIGYFYMRE